MKRLVRRSGAVGMGLIWAAGWVLAGGVIEALSNIGVHLPIEPLFDMWPMEMAIPGIVGGVLFAAMLWIAERRRIEAVSPSGVVQASGLPTSEGRRQAGGLHHTAWGAVAGLLIGVLGSISGLASELYPDQWPRVAVIIVITTALGAVSGLGSALVFRYAAPEARDVRPVHERDASPGE